MESTAMTELRKSSYTFTWRIANFDVICPVECQSFDWMKSTTFTAGEDIGMDSKWLVKISGSSGSIGCYLQLQNDSNSDEESIDDSHSVSCSLKINLGNDNNKFEHTKNAGVHKFTKIEKDWGYKEFIEISKLYEKKATLLKDNTLQICVQMEIHGEPYSMVTMLPLRQKCENTLEVMSTDYQELFNNQKHSDVEIVCGTKTFSAHKVILSTRSKVFCSMFDSNMKEFVSNQVIITDIDEETIHAVLLYIYTGKVIINESISYTDLIYGAEKYDLPQMKNYCFEKMYESVNDDTIGTLAVAADTYNADKDIQEAVKNYCLSNLARLSKNSAFKDVLKSHPKIFFED